MRRIWDIEFESNEAGIGISADTREEAIKIAEDPMNWRDLQPRKVTYCELMR